MIETFPSEDSSPHLVGLLKSCEFNKDNCDISVTASRVSGIIHVRHGVVLSAHAGILHGNGALLSLAQLEGVELETTPTESPVQKTIFLSIDQVVRYLSNQKSRSSQAVDFNEEALLEEAKTLLFRFHYKDAVDRLIAILRRNRFFYPAWLWQSRLLTRQDYISRALDEAYRWGNHDQDVWRESRKMRPQLSQSDEPAKRCIFCWSLLADTTSCPHCRARFSITAMVPPADLKKEEIGFAISGFRQARNDDPKNARVAFALALGHFNLGELREALLHLQAACELSPNTSLYTKSLSLLETINEAEKNTSLPPLQSRQPAQPDKKALSQILMVEDSMTSRKVLAMLLKRYHLHLLEAATGHEALALAASQRPRLILLDLMLPDTNGHDLLARLREFAHLKDVPVIMLTGRHDAKERLKGIQGGAQEFITKPFNPQKLTELIQSYLKVNTEVVPRPLDQPATGVSVATLLPSATVPESPVTSQPAAEPQQSSPAATPTGKSILVIEDSRTSRKVLTMLLTRHGYHLHEAASGREALEIAPTISPDLVLLDVMLPDMTGYTVLPKLREIGHYTELPFIMLTGNRKATDRLQGILAGTNEYITKPFDPQKLLGIIRNYL